MVKRQERERERERERGKEEEEKRKESCTAERRNGTCTIRMKCTGERCACIRNQKTLVHELFNCKRCFSFTGCSFAVRRTKGDIFLSFFLLSILQFFPATAK